jgi:DNA-binding protein Fis
MSIDRQGSALVVDDDAAVGFVLSGLLLQARLRRAGDNRTQAARLPGISRRTLYEKRLAEFGLD